MLFNSQNFAIFFPVVLAIYWLCYRWYRLQMLLLLAANYYFYFNFHKTFPIYLTVLILATYGTGLLLERMEGQQARKILLTAIVALLGAGLLYLKYSGLLLGNIPGMSQWQTSALHLLIPIGVSYFTFSSIGYVTDVYRRTVPAERNLVVYAAYISFFPHILCGPIPSAAILLPRFRKPTFPEFRVLELSLSEIIWGLFKKMVVADNMVMAVNYCFANFVLRRTHLLVLYLCRFFRIFGYCPRRGEAAGY
jgi:D-alanyl-lipoteichoic acid acyltransferase DltB (MBOAT superfamily)